MRKLKLGTRQSWHCMQTLIDVSSCIRWLCQVHFIGESVRNFLACNFQTQSLSTSVTLSLSCDLWHGQIDIVLASQVNQRMDLSDDWQQFNFWLQFKWKSNIAFFGMTSIVVIFCHFLTWHCFWKEKHRHEHQPKMSPKVLWQIANDRQQTMAVETDYRAIESARDQN